MTIVQGFIPATTEGKKPDKKKREEVTPGKHHYGLYIALMALAMLAIVAAVFNAGTSTQTSSAYQPPQDPKQPVFGLETPSPTEKGQEKGIIDPYGRKVDSKNIINVGRIQTTTSAFEQPPSLVRGDNLNIQVNFKSNQLTAKANKIPIDKITVVRVKIFDEIGLVKFGKIQEPADYIELTLNSNGEERGQVMYDDILLRPIEGKVELEVLIYFMDKSSIPASTGSKEIKI